MTKREYDEEWERRNEILNAATVDLDMARRDLDYAESAFESADKRYQAAVESLKTREKELSWNTGVLYGEETE